MILFSWITYIFSLHWFRDIYRRYFLRNTPIISLADYKEKIEIYTKYLEKKSNLVGSKYLRLHRWIAQVRACLVKFLQAESLHFASWICDFATWRWFCNLVHNLQMISHLGSQLWKWNFNLRSGTRVLEGGFAAAKFSLSFARLSSNGHNFFVSAPIHTPFEALDF